MVSWFWDRHRYVRCDELSEMMVVMVVVVEIALVGLWYKTLSGQAGVHIPFRLYASVHTHMQSNSFDVLRMYLVPSREPIESSMGLVLRDVLWPFAPRTVVPWAIVLSSSRQRWSIIMIKYMYVEVMSCACISFLPIIDHSIPYSYIYM